MAGPTTHPGADHEPGTEPQPDQSTPLTLLARLLAHEIANALQRSPAPKPPARLALSPDEAAQALGVSRDFFDQHLLPELRIVRCGRRRLIPLTELERWLNQAASRPLNNHR